MRLIVDHELPADYYTKEMKGILADGKLISEILSEKCTKLHEHLKNLGNDQNYYFFHSYDFELRKYFSGTHFDHSKTLIMKYLRPIGCWLSSLILQSTLILH